MHVKHLLFIHHFVTALCQTHMLFSVPFFTKMAPQTKISLFDQAGPEGFHPFPSLGEVEMEKDQNCSLIMQLTSSAENSLVTFHCSWDKAVHTLAKTSWLPGFGPLLPLQSPLILCSPLQRQGPSLCSSQFLTLSEPLHISFLQTPLASLCSTLSSLPK